MAFVILFCLFIGHGVLAGRLDQRKPRPEVPNVGANLPQRSLNKIREANHSQPNLPTDNSNNLVFQHDPKTATGGRVNSTIEVETAETALRRPPVDSIQTERRLKSHRALKKSSRRFRMGSQFERKIFTEVGATSTHSDATTADNTRRFSRIKSNSEPVHRREVVNHNKRTRPRRKFPAEFRRVFSDANNLESELISVFPKSDRRSHSDAVSAQYVVARSTERGERKKVLQEASGDRYPQLVPDYEATTKDESWDYQALDPESSFDVPSAFLNEYDERKADDRDSFLDGFFNELDTEDVRTDKKSGRVKRAENETEKSMAADASIASSASDFTMAVAKASIRKTTERAGPIVYPTDVPAGAPAVTGEEPSSVKGNVLAPDASELPGDVTEGYNTTTARSKSSSSSSMRIVWGVLGGMVLGGVITTFAILLYINTKKKPEEKAEKAEKEPLKPGAKGAKGAASKTPSGIAKAAAAKASKSQVKPPAKAAAAKAAPAKTPPAK